ncbi:MAG: CPBP family intramembrane metalloprotease [Clostridia bacterium]|nr:CPBP family intramembrane metalloprotease [Clostridia bacterium]
MRPLRKKSELSVQSALALLLLLICAAAIVFFYSAPPVIGDSVLYSLVYAVIPRFFICVFLLVLILEVYPDLLAWKRISWKNLLWCVLPLLVTIVNFPFSALILGTARMTRAELIWLFIIKCLLIGISEELLFRGIIFSSLSDYFKKKGRSCFLPVLFSSVIFGLFHFINLFDGAGILAVLQQVGYSFLIGAMLAIVLLKTKNIWLCIFLHALFDFGGFFVSDLGTGNPQDLTFWILTIVVGILCTVQMIITLIKIIKKRP